MKHLPNFISALRMIGATCLLFCEVTGVAFWTLYFLCGISDMTDGWLARKLGVATKTGAMLDSLADICFVACCCWQILPIVKLPLWLWIWAGAIALIKVKNQIMALMLHGRCCFPHTLANKVTGFLLFVTAPTAFVSIIPIAFVEGIATFAAIHEGYCIKNKE